MVLLTSVGAVVAAASLAAQAIAGIESAALILALVAAQTSCTALGFASRRAFIPRLLPQPQVAAEVALEILAFQVAMLVGPAVAGVVLARGGFGWAYAVDALAILLSPAWHRPRLRPAAADWRACWRWL